LAKEREWIREDRDKACEAMARADINKAQRLQRSELQRYLADPGKTLSVWYIILASAVGVRLGKVTAEILQRVPRT
jgi:hypothetical protein